MSQGPSLDFSVDAPYKLKITTALTGSAEGKRNTLSQACDKCTKILVLSDDTLKDKRDSQALLCSPHAFDFRAGKASSSQPLALIFMNSNTDMMNYIAAFLCQLVFA